MKKNFLAFMILTAVLCTAFPAFAENTIDGSCGEHLTWLYDYSSKTLTISGEGNMSNYYSSGTAGSRAPWITSTSIKNNLETVVISDGVTSIGEYAFFYCEKLKNITIPSSVKSIGIGAFYHCDALPEITIPNGVESICNEAFQYCNGLKEVTIPGSVKNIGEGAFSNCYISADESETGIESGLEKVIIQDGTESIGGSAFYMCEKLNTITLPDSVTSIGYWAFYDTGCYNDWEDSEDDVLYIGNHFISAYQGKSTPCDIKSGTKTIADYAFFACRDLPGITIPDSVESIGNHAFESSNSLTNITIPKSVTSIGSEAFYSCFDLADINVDPDNPAYCSENGVLYNKTKTEIIRFPSNKKDSSFTTPIGAAKIADGAFEFCRYLKSITISDGVTSIGNHAFENCYFEKYEKGKIISVIGLEKATIPDSVTSIGSCAFLKCSKLTSITIPDGVAEIGERTFYQCRRLASITIPNSVLIIGKEAFEECPKSMKVNYIGSEADWEMVIGDGKYVLTYADISYLSGISAKHSADGKSIVVKPINIVPGKTVILALYDGDRFVEMKQSSEYGDDNREIIFTPAKSYTNAKAMIWNGLDSLSPVCSFKNVK